MILTIEITSDFICPWCLVAETRLNKAIAQLNPSVDIQCVWHPFELNPNMPEMGEYSQLLDAKTIEATQGDGIRFRYDSMKITPNTLRAHRLTWFAAQQGKATEMAERILKAYFTEGQNIVEVEILTSLADEVGIDGNIAKTFLLSDAGTQEVHELERRAVARGIHGVPSICIGQEVLSGAQSVDVFFAVLQNAVNKLITA
jgi:predicted DsbA family dithiol-disulfide isomerase